MKRHALFSLAIAALLLVACLSPLPLMADPPTGGAAGGDSARSAAGEGEKIEWLSFAAGKTAAAESGRPMLVNFTASWCIYCKKMKKETYADPGVIAYVNEHYIPVRVDTQQEPRLAADYYVRSIPIIWFLGADGQRITSLPGYVDPENFLLVLAFIATESYNTMDFETFVNARSSDS